MQDEEPRPLPTTLGGLYGRAAGLYLRRAVLYALPAVVALIVQYIGDIVLPHNDGTVSALNIVLDAFVLGVVASGVARDLAGDQPRWTTILGVASERWGVLAVVGTVAFFTQQLTVPGVTGPPDETGYGFFITPIAMLWAVIALAQVSAAIEPAASRLQLPLIALGRGVALALHVGNLGRWLWLSLTLVIPTLVQPYLYAELAALHIPDAWFWAEIPLDALTLGPLQALTTIFYLDFARRARRRAR